MKTKGKIVITAIVIFTLAGFSACKSSQTVSNTERQASAASANISTRAEQTADDMRIVDWQNRSIGEIACPAWLLPAVRGSWNLFKADWPVSPDKVLKYGVARHATLNGAQTIAEVQYAARLAAQLRQTVLTRSAVSLDTDGEFDLVNNAAVQVNVNISGQERLTDFWQLVETDGPNGRRTRMYNYWVVYACDSAIWDQLVAKYIFDIVGQLPQRRTQQVIAGMFDEINAELKYERERTEAQFNAELAARQQALARETPMTSTEIRIAFQSNDPAQIAAAGTTRADEDYVAALTALAQNR
jgi:hypothetical protein